VTVQLPRTIGIEKPSWFDIKTVDDGVRNFGALNSPKSQLCEKVTLELADYGVVRAITSFFVTCLPLESVIAHSSVAPKCVGGQVSRRGDDVVDRGRHDVAEVLRLHVRVCANRAGECGVSMELAQQFLDN